MAVDPVARGLALTKSRSASVPITAGGSTSGYLFSETITPTATAASPVAIGLRNDLTISGDMSKITGTTDLLSGNFTTNFSGVTAGPVTTMGAFQAGLYINSNNAGITFNGLRGFVAHLQVDAACTVSLLKGFELILPSNAGTISNLRWIDIPDTSTTTGGGSITNEWALYSPGGAKVEVAGLGRFGKLDITSTANSGVANGFYLGAANQLTVRTSSGDRFNFNSSGMSASAGSGPRIVANTNATATVPTLIPNQLGTTSGVGANAAGEVSLIASATEKLRATSTQLLLLGVPTADPHVVGAVWSNSGVLTLSAG